MPEDLSSVMEACVAAFVRKSRQERYLSFLPFRKQTHLSSFDLMLEHRLADELDPRFVIRIDGDAATVLQRLKDLGAPSDCWLFWQAADSRARIPLADALDTVVWAGVPSFTTCIPGRLAYYEDETSHIQVILHRANSARRRMA